MRFFGTIFAWAFAVLIAYGLASIFSTQTVLGQMAALETDVSWAMRWNTTLADLAGLHFYGIVIAIAFATGFFLASLLKAAVPILTRLAYPLGAVASVALALFLMKWMMPGNTFPIAGAETAFGFILQLTAALIGGVVFDLCRPKPDDEQ